MKKSRFGILLFSLLFVAAFSPLAHADQYQDKLDFASGLEETLGHFWALELNLDEGNAQLAVTHATHPIAELYHILKPMLKATDSDLDMRFEIILSELKDTASTNVSRAQAQHAVDDAKEMVELVRTTIIEDELSNDPNFKLGLMKSLLEVSAAEYGAAVKDGMIVEMAEFQDGSAFVWRSQQIFETISSDIDSQTRSEINDMYDNLWKAYDDRATVPKVQTHTNNIIGKIDGLLGIESKDTDLLVYVENIRTLLAQTKEAYQSGDKDLALSLSTKAYLDNYEFLEGPLVDLGKEELSRTVEIMIREDLRDLIKQDAPVSDVNMQIDAISEQMDTIAVVVPEFGTVAMMILVVAIISMVAISAKSRLVPRV